MRSIIGKKRKLSWGIEWSSTLADGMHKPIRRKFKKRRVFASGVDAIRTADLVDMQSFAKSNKGYKFILVIIDVFSKFGWGVPLKTKTGSEVAKAFQELWTTHKPPQKLWTDRGREF